MESAVFGLIGVVIGSLLTIAKEWWFQQRRAKKDATYLSIKVSCELLKFAGSCANVAGDSGEEDGNGCCIPRTSTPSFKPEMFDVEWKALPDRLMFEILDLPFKIEQADETISGVYEYVAGPPDYSEWYEERQLQYATLGLFALNVAAQLRSYVGLTFASDDNCYPRGYLEQKKALIEKKRAQLIETDC
ncbi:hypothetical protein [Quatrionicoccus australiensis]|uniref:hypothetical protein n=1 Tax=Quatrionicoccus australiensis TaxID=138118 RepID=UPI001CF81BEE|nr:hypothetical protein [Quatrionicoccus australiensis]UCV13693.1 hypothetical protein KI612_12075 [Quatrionicoccus australiensis]